MHPLSHGGQGPLPVAALPRPGLEVFFFSSFFILIFLFFFFFFFFFFFTYISQTAKS